MTKDKRRIQSCIDHINTAVDVDPWAKELVAEMGKEILKAQLSKEDTTSDCISRRGAIDHFKSIADATSIGNKYNEGFVDGLNFAVGHLETMPSVQPDVPDTNVGDLISRQAAIDALDVLCQEHRYKIPGKQETYSQYNEAWQDALDRAEGAIGNLPSVQPEPLSDAYMKAVWTWLLDYQIKAAELKGRYTSYEVLSWVVNDWRKEHE